MKLKHFIYSICLAGVAFTSCQKEEELENMVDVTSPYVLDYLANSSDEIDQRRYQIFETYGVPVFFNDVISEEVVGKDYKGEPIYKRETLDIAWDFYTKNSGATFNFTYIITPDTPIDDSMTEEEKAAIEEQNAAKRETELANAHLALDYVETYLSMAGKMKPFSILLLNMLDFNGVKEFYNGYRTLYLSNASKYSDPADMRMKSAEVINSSVLEYVNKQEALLAEFEAVCDEKHYYNKKWVNDLGESFSADLQSFMNSPFYLKLSHAYDDEKLLSLSTHTNMYYVKAYYEWYGLDYSSMFSIPSLAFALKYYNNLEAMQEVAYEMVAIAAKYGFVGGGWSSENTNTPNASKDVEVFVKTIMQLGGLGFEKRYGQYPLVMQKYEILRAYIQDEIGYDLNYDNVN